MGRCWPSTRTRDVGCARHHIQECGNRANTLSELVLGNAQAGTVRGLFPLVKHWDYLVGPTRTRSGHGRRSTVLRRPDADASPPTNRGLGFGARRLPRPPTVKHVLYAIGMLGTVVSNVLWLVSVLNVRWLPLIVVFLFLPLNLYLTAKSLSEKNRAGSK